LLEIGTNGWNSNAISFFEANQNGDKKEMDTNEFDAT
jgi:hypothetical protein